MDKRDETSVWKKEIAFGRKSKPEAESKPQPNRAAGDVAPAKPAKTSIWKKEIAFGRKSKPKAESKPQPNRAAGDVAPAKPAKTSIWKKEITFGRKPKKGAGFVVLPKTGQPAQPESDAPLESLRSRPRLSYDPVVPPALPLVSAPITPPVSAPITPPVSAPAVPPVSAPTTPPVSAPTTPPVSARAAPPVSAQAVPPVSAPTTPPVSAPAMPPVSVPPPSSVAPPPVGVPVTPSPAHSPPPSPRELETLGPEAEEATEVAVPVPAPVVEAARPEPDPDPDPEPDSEPEHEPAAKPAEPPRPSRRERRNDRRAADRLSKEQQKREKELAKEDRKANRHSRVVGLKIGASQIAAAEVVNKGGPRIVRMARMPLERGVVVGGELREPDELAAQLKTFFRKNKFPRTCVRLGISNDRIGVRTFEITGIDDPRQLANAVRFRAQETLPIPLEEAVLDYRVLENKVGEDGIRVRRVLLVVAHRELVERYAAACRKAGLKLIGIDLEAFGLLRALSDPAHPPAEDAAVVCISIGHERSTLAVSDGRVCEFTRVLGWGGSALDVALARVLDLTPSAVAPIKHALSLGEAGEGAGLDARRADEARRAMAAELQGFARELIASLRFYQEQPNSLGIVEILLTGGTAACGGLAAELERLTGLPVRVADPLSRVKVQRKLRGGENGSLAVAVGLAIED